MLQRFLYLSRIEADANADAPAQILRQSRERNHANGISGALVFDGERFCQLIEGPPAVVRELAAKIAIDPRHGAMRVLLDRIDATPRLLDQWHGGTCGAHTLDPLDAAEAPEPAAALATFLGLLPLCELES